MSKAYACHYSCLGPITDLLLIHPSTSSSYIFIKLSWKITWPRSLLPMRVDGISILKSFMLKRNGQKQSWFHLWLTIVRTVVFFSLGLAEMCSFSSFADPIFLILYRELYYRHVYSRLQPNIDDRFHSYENSCELFNYLLSASIAYIYNKIWHLTCHRFWRTCTAWTAGTMALGYHRRIYLSISGFLYLALKSHFENTRWTVNVGWGWSCKDLLLCRFADSECWSFELW